MSTLTKVYDNLATGDRSGIQKTAAVNPEITKLASHYDQLGRNMARGMFAEHLKTAMPEEEAAVADGEAMGAAGGEEDELARRKAEILAKLQEEQAAEAAGAGAEAPPV